MPRILYPEFRDEFSQTRYPFADTATLTSADSAVRLDHGTFADASLYPLNATAPISLGRITIAARRVDMELRDGLDRAVATATFNPFVPTEHIAFEDSWGRPAGILVANVARLGYFSGWPPGVHTFTQQATTFAASCVIPLPEKGVRGLLSARDELLTGDAWLVGDRGVVVRQISAHEVRIDIVGDPLFRRRLCVPLSLFETPNFIRTINGCPPDIHGNFNLTVGDHMNGATILRVYPSARGLVVEAIGTLAKGGG